MCIGIPMQIVEMQGDSARCVYKDRESLVDMMLTGPQPIGSWVLVFLDTAREVLNEQRAHQIADALEALQLTLQGENQIDHLFADLIGREPQLPEFLRS